MASFACLWCGERMEAESLCEVVPLSFCYLLFNCLGFVYLLFNDLLFTIYYLLFYYLLFGYLLF